MRRAIGVTAVIAGAAASLVLGGLAVGSTRHTDALDEVRAATRRYQNLDAATDAGYVQFFGCVHEPWPDRWGSTS